MRLDGPVVIVATKNKGKVREFAHAFAPFGKEVKSMYDYPDIPDVVEDGTTFAENALKKAKAVGDVLGLPVLADDSGLCVDLLDGAPGVYSARYAGEGASDHENNIKLLDVLESKQLGDDTGQPLLSPAQFVCTLILYNPQTGETLESTGSVEGWITTETAGSGGFGYDPLFYLPEFEKTMAELTLEQKQAISHRGIALRNLATKLGNPQE
ncbi:XTP/dITP diphosphatase [Paenibacillus polymyxa]|uniref:XTP/dITP diphosphatase n=1 Tax=Paenibacillus polymyxa TaxID=1406 RepID=UPI000EE0F431|nr:XTP/dITP diphosphatase [Paenibacillus polymyxa]MEE4579871.1 XTP/dITP diphosphatase [Paenibacillus polymyxa]RGL37302.1 XTP/dITP diphosphatase [Paenibacillus polymyxa]UMR34803.1 XTP/dITP diphosphatase [Paenibacillus polymyxa]